MMPNVMITCTIVSKKEPKLQLSTCWYLQKKKGKKNMENYFLLTSITLENKNVCIS